jgi:hypothetical protein
LTKLTKLSFPMEEIKEIAVKNATLSKVVFFRRSCKKIRISISKRETFVQNVHSFVIRSSTSGFCPDATNRVTHKY